MPAFASAEQPLSFRDPNSEWTLRQNVTLWLTGEPQGPVRSVEVVETRASPARTDSLVAALSASPMPCGGIRPGVPVAAEAKKCLGIVQVVVALDRRASALGFAPDVRLPPEVRQALATGSLACWAQAWRSTDPAFDWADFVLQAWRALPYPRSRMSKLLPSLAARDSFGMLHDSPDGRWVLDSFQGVDLMPGGRLANDVDTGTALYETSSGDRIDHWVGTTTSGHLAAWIRDDAYVVVGSARIQHPELRGVWFDAPAIWYGDLEAGRERFYHGAPAPPPGAGERTLLVLRCLRAAYPRLRFE